MIPRGSSRQFRENQMNAYTKMCLPRLGVDERQPLAMAAATEG
jgi:hypothetical protein